MKIKSILFLSTLLVMFVCILPVSKVTATPSEWEHYEGSVLYQYELDLASWGAQTFTVGVANHTVTSVQLYVVRAGSTAYGNLIVGIRATDGEGHPTGGDLTNGSVTCLSVPLTDGWVEITVTEYALSANTKYAIVARAPSEPSGSHCIEWWYHNGDAYADGNYEYSVNSGLTWAGYASDFRFQVWGNGLIPTIGQFQAPSGRVNINSLFYVNATIQHPSGIANFVNATLTLNYTIHLNWFNSTNTFNKTGDTSSYCTLDSGIRTTVNSTAYKLSWKVKFSNALNWNVVNAVVFASGGLSGTNSKANVFITDYVKIDSFSVSDSHLNSGDTASFTVGGKYASDNSAWSGTYTLNDTASKSAVGKYGYNISAITDSNYALTVFNQTASNLNVIFDKIKVSGYVVSDSDGTADINHNVNIDATLIYEYDSTALTTGTITINGYSTSHQGSGVYRITRTSPSATSVTYDMVAGSESAYGLSVVNQNGKSATVVWNRVIVSINANSTNPNAGQTIQSIITATYEYGGASVTNWTVNILRNGTHFALGNFTDMSLASIIYQYTTENITEGTYGLTVFSSNTLTVAWTNLFIEVNQLTVAENRINVGVQAIAYYHCRWSGNQSSCITGTLYVNGTGFSINGTGWATVTFTFSGVCKKVLVLTGVNVNGETDYAQIPANPEIVWDRIAVYYFAVDDSRVNINDTVKVRVRAELEYDSHAFGSGDSINVNGSALSWDATNSWFEGAFAKSAVGNWTFQVSSGIEVTFNITSVYHAVSQPYTCWDSLEVYSLQLTYLGNSQYKYQASIRYGYGHAAVSGATLKLLYPNLITETSFTSNSTGWISFILAQGNITQTGAWLVYGYSDNHYGITYKAENQTFNIWTLALTAKNWNQNATLLDATFKIYYGGTLATEFSSAYLPENAYKLQVFWLENLLVNETASYSLAATTSLNLKCMVYPYTLSGTQYHWASNATWASQSWNSTSLKLEIQFSSSASNYTLVANGPRPTYLLNVSFSMPVDYTTYLSLAHYGNRTITISYEAWGDFYIRSTQHRLSSVYWTEQKLTIVVLGTTGESGTLTVYCGSRASPHDATGLASPTYNADTKILSGAYTFSSVVTVTLDWKTSTGGSTGGTSTFGKLDLMVDDARLSLVKGSTATFNLTIRWSGINDITISRVTITEEYVTWFSLFETLPKQASKGSETEGITVIQVKISVPWQITLGQHTIPVTVSATQEGGITIEKSGVIYLSVTSGAVGVAGIPEYMTYLFLFAVVGLASYAFIKKKR